MMTTTLPPLEQHDVEIQRNREAWGRKLMLREIHHDFHRLIAARIDPQLSGPVVELGSDMGRIKDDIPQWVTTDLFPNPWLDRGENCYQLSFADTSVSHFILFDVWHHLRYPATALREFHRVLVPGGRLILFEPAASWLGRFIPGPQLDGRFLLNLMRGLDSLTTSLPRACAARLLVLLG